MSEIKRSRESKTVPQLLTAAQATTHSKRKEDGSRKHKRKRTRGEDSGEETPYKEKKKRKDARPGVVTNVLGITQGTSSERRNGKSCKGVGHSSLAEVATNAVRLLLNSSRLFSE